MWDGQFELLAGRYGVIRYDVRGFGKSACPRAQSFDMPTIFERCSTTWTHPEHVWSACRWVAESLFTTRCSIPMLRRA